jgi:hypothetical protein
MASFRPRPVRPFLIAAGFLVPAGELNVCRTGRLVGRRSDCSMTRVTTLKPALLALTISALSLVCTPAPAAPESRLEFARAMARLRVTGEADSEISSYDERASTEAQVIAALGKPDDVITPADGIGLLQGEKRLCYGTNGHLTFPTLGMVDLDGRGKARFLWGATGSPPPTALFREPELRDLLRLLDGAPVAAFAYLDGWDPLAAIRIVNRLRLLGKDRALAAIEEYVRLTTRLFAPNEATPPASGLKWMLLLLFEMPADHSRAGTPVVLHGGVPFLVPQGPWVETPWLTHQDLAPYRARGRLRERPLRPMEHPVEAFHGIQTSPAWTRVENDGRPYVRYLLANQLLRLVRPAYSPPKDLRDAWRTLGARGFEEQWANVERELSKLGLRWDARANTYRAARAPQLNEAAAPGRDGVAVDALVLKFRRIPYWTRVTWGDRDTNPRILKGLIELAGADLDTLRAAVREVLSHPTHDWMDINNNVQILNRCLFAVPDIWPMYVDQRGELALQPTFRGMTGSIPNGLQEFDRFRAQYGRRAVPGRIDPAPAGRTPRMP